MSQRCYSEINLHVTWHVKGNLPTLRDDIEHQVHRYLHDRIAAETDVRCHAIGGTDDHLHIVASVPATLTVSEWIGRLKGGSAHYVNNVIANRKVLQWQTGYGVVSFGTQQLPWVTDYVRRQREHHAAGSEQARLEQTTSGQDPPAEAG